MNPGNERTYTFREVVAAAVVDAIEDRLITLDENASETDIHTAREIETFAADAALLREALAIIEETK